jgi:hypothetical protein
MKVKDYFASDKDPVIVEVEWLLERYRNWRKYELTTTDWTQLPDAPVDTVAYATYRQALRDLPSVQDFANVELPIKPGGN